MSSTALEPAVLPTKDEFGDLFDYYVADDNLPSTEWLTRLRLERPRRNTRCLGETTRLLKRINDVVVSATMLILLSPVLLLVAMAVAASAAAVAEEVGRHDCSVGHRPASAGDELS